jgi:antitoxin HicB
MRYPISLTPSDGKLVVQVDDIAGVNTFGDDREDALAQAADALETMLDHYFENKLPVPLPSKVRRGRSFVEIPVSISAKILLHNELLDQQVRPSELARRLKLPRQEMTRLLDLHTVTKIDSIAEAMKALGKSIELQVA